MAAHARLKNEFTEDEKYHNLIRWLIYRSINDTVELRVKDVSWRSVKIDISGAAAKENNMVFKTDKRFRQYNIHFYSFFNRLTAVCYDKKGNFFLKALLV